MVKLFLSNNQTPKQMYQEDSVAWTKIYRGGILLPFTQRSHDVAIATSWQ